MWEGKHTGLAIAVVVAGVLASCSGSGDGKRAGEPEGGSPRSPHSPLSVARVKELAADPGGSCPVSYDLADAARAAKVPGRVAARGVEGETADRSDPEAPLALFDGALVSCGYTVGSETARVYTVGVRKGSAVGVLLPQVQHDAGISMGQLKDYAERSARARRGKPVVTPSGNVAAVRLPVAGAGDVALVLAVGEGSSELSESRVAALAREVAGRVHA